MSTNSDSRDGETRDDPLDVADAVEVFDDRLQRRRRFEQRGDSALPGIDVLDVAQRRPQPLPQQPATHARARALDGAE